MKEKLIALITNSLHNLNINDLTVEITKPKLRENGDFSCNVALKLAKVLGKSPMVIAEDVVSVITKEEKINLGIDNIEIKEPGFINFFVNPTYLFTNLNTCLEQGSKYGSSNIGQKQKYNIEFVSANPTGILHLGNARGGAYGDSLARILKFSGYDVTKEYYVNDAGNQITNLALSIKCRYLELCGKDAVMPENGYFGAEIITIAQKL